MPLGLLGIDERMGRGGIDPGSGGTCAVVGGGSTDEEDGGGARSYEFQHHLKALSRSRLGKSQKSEK